LFKDREKWVLVGTTKTDRTTSHRRPVGVWRLNNDPGWRKRFDAHPLHKKLKVDWIKVDHYD
jgi:hypothetical protein